MCTSWPKDRADCAVDARIIHPERRCCTHLLLAGRKFGTLSRLAAETAKVRPNAARGNPRQQPCRATGKGRQRKCRLDPLHGARSAARSTATPHWEGRRV